MNQFSTWNDVFNEVLDDNEKAKLIAFNQDESMKEAVKKVLLFTVYNNGVLKKGKKSEPTMNAAYRLIASAEGATNDQVANLLRAQWQGVSFLDLGFQEIDKFQNIKVEKPKLNPAR